MLWRLLFMLIGVLAANAARADLIWGANGHPITAYPGISVEEQLDYLQDLGMTYYRVDVPDMGRAPELADLIAAGKARGIAILPVITPGGVDLEKDDAESIYSASYDLGFALASRFKGEVRVWELGNELENYAIITSCEMRDDGTQYPCEWGPAGGTTPLEYYGPRWAKVSAVLKGLSDGVAKADPLALKAMGTAGWGHLGAFQRMRDDGIRWDISVWHTYGQNPEWAFKVLKEFHRPIWVTEFNNPYGSQRGEDEQVAGLTKMMKQLRVLADPYDVQAAFVYELMDESYWTDMEGFQGLVRMVKSAKGDWRAGEPKPAYAAARELIRGEMPPPSAARDCPTDAGGSGPVTANAQIAAAYCLVLGRAPDEQGLAGWRTTLSSVDDHRTNMLIAMLTSREFIAGNATFALTDEDYVGFLYRLLLNREPDVGGLQNYASGLASGAMSRVTVVAGLIFSDEFRALHPIFFASVQASADAAPATLQ